MNKMKKNIYSQRLFQRHAQTGKLTHAYTALIDQELNLVTPVVCNLCQ